MDEKNKFIPLFPAEYSYLESSHQQLLRELNAIDNELSNLPADKGPKLEYTPLGAKAANDPFKNHNRKETLKEIRDDKITTARSTFESELITVDDKTKIGILDRFDHETSKNRFKDLPKSELEAAKNDVKKGDEVFDFIPAKYFNQYQQPTITDEKENIDTWTDRFMARTNQHKEKYEREKSTSLSREDLEARKDNLDLDKD